MAVACAAESRSAAAAASAAAFEAVLDAAATF